MGFLIPAVPAIAGIVRGVIRLVGTTGNDNANRENFTQEFVKKARMDFPDYNVVIIHPKHNRDGIFIHDHQELPISLNRTIGYEIYFSKIGDPFNLENLGDGGYINWAFAGYNRDGNRLSS